MSRLTPTHVVDTSVLIQAHRGYYPFDVCPGFWDCVRYHAEAGRIVSIDHVRSEINAGKDQLRAWGAAELSRRFFASTQSAEVVGQFSALMQWVQAAPQFFEAAKDEFARVADGWIVAYAKIHGLIVVTQEVANPTIKKKVPLPNVCDAFDVPWVNTFDMLRALDCRFTWTPPEPAP